MGVNARLAAMAYGITEEEASRHVAAGKCVGCGGNASSFGDRLSEREFLISGLCQSCQDDAWSAMGPEE